MKLYEVVRWGNDGDDPFRGGPNGDDTCFLVRAESVQEAASLADAVLKQMTSATVASFAQVVYELGTDTGNGTDARIIRGPYEQNAYNYGWAQWERDTADGEWSRGQR